MAQLAIYIDDALSEKLDAAAKAAGKSRSKWVTDLVRQRLADEWPAGFHELIGSWQGGETTEEIMASIRDGLPPLEEREEL